MLSVPICTDDDHMVGAHLQRTNDGNMKKWQMHQCSKYTMIMLTFFGALRNETANSLSLKLFVSVIIDDMEIVCADSQRANVGNMEKVTIVPMP